MTNALEIFAIAMAGCAGMTYQRFANPWVGLGVLLGGYAGSYLLLNAWRHFT